MAETGHRWRFFRAGGVDQVMFRSGADLAALEKLDQKLWMTLAMPTRGVEFDPRTADLLDTDKDGRLRPPELLAAVAWARGAFTDLDRLLEGGESVPLSAIRDAELLAGAKRVLADLKKPDATAIALADVQDTAALFAQTRFNGDGVVPVEAADEESTRKALEDVIAVLGPVQDRSGKPGVNQANLDAFFTQAQAYVDWVAKAEGDPAIWPGGRAAAEAAAAAVDAVRAKVDDFFTRCALAAFDPRAAAALNRDEKDYAALAAKALNAGSEDVAALPLARVAPGAPLPLAGGVNPAWQARVATFASAAVTPLLGDRAELPEADWLALQAKLAPYLAWRAAKPADAVEKLGLERLRALIAEGFQAKIAALVAHDKSLEKEFAQLEGLEKLVRLQRDLVPLLHNFVSFAEFYGRRGAFFQAGTLFLDARSCDLCLEVADAAKHALLAQLSGAYLAYCDITRPGEPKKTIVAAFTNGDSDNLLVGRNGVFYDRKGRDWDATIVKIAANPISVREAFFLPYKKFVRVVQEQIAKRAQAADQQATIKIQTVGTEVANADSVKPPEKKEAQPKLDLGTIALIGTAVGGVSALVAGFLSSIFGLGPWMPLGLLGIVLLISGPSMLIAYLKLRQRNLAPILDANGWAINARARMNVAFGASLTRLAALPAGAERTLDDPFPEKRRPWGLYVFLLALAFVLLWWAIGRLDRFLPEPVRRAHVFHAAPAAKP